MPNTCTCAKPPDTPQPQFDARCPACGNAIEPDETNAIQSEPHVRHQTNIAFDDAPLSIQKNIGFVRSHLGVAMFVAALIAGTFAWQYWRIDAQQDIGPMPAIRDNGLTNAVQSYFLKHNGKFPATLELLLQKDEFGGPYLEAPESLIDSWGNRYQYDIKGPRNNGTRPDIWTVAPDGSIVGNWRNAR